MRNGMCKYIKSRLSKARKISIHKQSQLSSNKYLGKIKKKIDYYNSIKLELKESVLKEQK